MSELTFDPPRGMRDFYPEDMAWRNRIFDAWRKAADLSGFQPYDACVVESLELLQRKSGEEVSEQIYAFEDKSGRKLALRPEMTPTLARMVLAKKGGLSFPIKWTTIAQCFRYERMTRGRKREHYQWNLDIIGEDTASAEVDILNTAVSALRLMGVPDSAWRIHISSRKLLGELLAHFQIAQETHAAVFLALDKRGKIPDEEIAQIMQSGGLSDKQVADVFQLLNLKTLEDVAKILPDSPALQQLRMVFESAAICGFGEILEFDIAVIRGLSYYTGIVFEAFDTNRTLRAIFGGGRYDSLLTSLGGSPTPAVGMGFGDVVVLELLKDLGIGAVDGEFAPGLAIGYMQQEQYSAALKLARRYREQGTRTDVMLAPGKPKQFFARIGNGAYSHAVYLGPDDLAAGQAQLKTLATREAETISL